YYFVNKNIYLLEVNLEEIYSYSFLSFFPMGAKGKNSTPPVRISYKYVVYIPLLFLFWPDIRTNQEE
ncbi:MAG: hypothetical protein ACK4SU_04055, partial [Dictyoglomus sp.]